MGEFLRALRCAVFHEHEIMPISVNGQFAWRSRCLRCGTSWVAIPPR